MQEIIEKVKAIINKDAPIISNLANVASILNEIPNINWCGFYLVRGDVLYLGPFIGEPACVLIPFGKGVCGTCAQNKETIIVQDVSKFAGHIACSSKSKSEIVVPIINKNFLYGVIDIDAPILDRFDEKEKDALEEIASIISKLF